MSIEDLDAQIEALQNSRMTEEDLEKLMLKFKVVNKE